MSKLPETCRDGSLETETFISCSRLSRISYTLSSMSVRGRERLLRRRTVLGGGAGAGGTAGRATLRHDDFGRVM